MLFAIFPFQSLTFFAKSIIINIGKSEEETFYGNGIADGVGRGW